MKNVIMAFRWRLKKRGYRDIHIKKLKGDRIWQVKAIEPLGNTIVCVEVTLEYMMNAFRF